MTKLPGFLARYHAPIPIFTKFVGATVPAFTTHFQLLACRDALVVYHRKYVV
jgi:hypothetical protein